MLRNGRVTCVGRAGGAALKREGREGGRRRGHVHVAHPRGCEGQDLPWLCGRRVRGSQGHEEPLGEDPVAGSRAPARASCLPRSPRRHHGNSVGRAETPSSSGFARPELPARPARARRPFRHVATPASPRTRVIVTLDDPPLAAATPRRALATVGARRKLNLRSSFSQSYLAQLATAQQRAIASLKKQFPSAKVSRRYRVLLNGFAVSLPYAKLPELLEASYAKRVYPSYTYVSRMNKGPAVIGAPQFAALAGVRGEDIKVAVVDDGVDEEHPFLAPAGLAYPAGLPEGAGRRDDAEGDRRARLRRPGREQRAARPRPVVPRDVRRGRHRGRGGDGRPGRAPRLLLARRTAGAIPP